LLVSSTGIMKRGDVAKMSVAAGTDWFWADTEPSRFIDMLGSSMPQPQLGSEYIRDM